MSKPSSPFSIYWFAESRQIQSTNMVILNAHFDGKTIVLDEPLSLPLKSGTRLKISVEVADDAAQITPSPRVFQPLKIRIDPELSNAIALDPEFGIEES